MCKNKRLSDNCGFQPSMQFPCLYYSFLIYPFFRIFIFFCGIEWSVKRADGTGCDSSCWPTLPPHLLPESQTREGDSACHRSPPQPACTHTCTNTTHTCTHTSPPTSLSIPKLLNILVAKRKKKLNCSMVEEAKVMYFGV